MYQWIFVKNFYSYIIACVYFIKHYVQLARPYQCRSIFTTDNSFVFNNYKLHWADNVSNFTLSHHCNSYKSYTSAPLTMLQYDLESSFIIITPPVFTPLMITFKQFVLPSRAASAAIETHFRSGTVYFIIIVVIWTV